MAVNYQTVGNYSPAAVTLVTTAETIIITSDPIATEYVTGKVIISAACILTTGTTTSSYTPQIRRGSALTGTAIGTAKNVACAAGVVLNILYMAIDTVGSGLNQYIFTITQNAATANGSAENNFIQLELLTG